MLNQTEKLINAGFANHVIHDSDLAFLFDGTPASRYALVNKALRKAELVRLCRGHYLLAPQYIHERLSSYYIANHLVFHSFVSMESALSFHGWIPERVVTVTSVATLGRSKEFSTPYGLFAYTKLPIEDSNSFVGVERVKHGEKWILMATPLRALIDYVYVHKIKNANSDFLINSLRIEPENVSSISEADIETSQLLYRSNYVKQFLKNLRNELYEK